VEVDFAFLFFKSEVQVSLYYVILKSRPMSPAYFCNVSFMKMLISCLLKSIISIKYLESGFLER
jgi:hypothetical protein